MDNVAFAFFFFQSKTRIGKTASNTNRRPTPPLTKACTVNIFIFGKN